jgi:sugar O-acyltransferase (sialic acid O-acetyltransferase NeuD family)
MQSRIVLIGGGGHCKSCIDVIEAENRFEIAGIVDVREKLGTRVLGYEVLATDDDLPRLVGDYQHFLITIGQMKNADTRVEKFECLKRLGASFPVIVSPRAHLSKHAAVNEGTVLMHNVIVNAGAVVGRNCIINTAAIIEHDVVIEDHCHISTGSTINGGTVIRKRTFFGSNSVAKEAIEIGERCIIGAGMSVMASIPAGTIVRSKDAT